MPHYEPTVVELPDSPVKIQQATAGEGTQMFIQDIEEIEEIIVKAYEFCKTLNRNIELRQALWKNGFFTEMKSLPGLIKHEHEALKAITACKFRLSQKS